MNKLRLGFVLDPPEKIKCLEDTSFYIMKEAFERGHDVYYIDSRQVYAQAGKIMAETGRVAVDFNDGFKKKEDFQNLDLAGLDLIFIRKDPPFDSQYLYLTYLLEKLKGQIPVLNDPAGIRGANEKFYILNFPEHIPATCVSSHLPVLLAFVGEAGDAVLKPLHERGGIGISRARRSDPDKEKIIRGMLSQYGTIMAQKFIPDILESGDMRVLMLNGEFLGAYSRIPPAGDFRVSVSRDGRYQKSVIGAREREIIESVGPRLRKDGLYFAGLDLIGGMISEINVTSPAGIPEINLFAGEKLEVKMVDFLEQFALY